MIIRPELVTVNDGSAKKQLDRVFGMDRTMLAKAGVAPRVAMEIMRHTDIRLTMNLYTDPHILNTARAIEQIPRLNDRPESQKATALRTGTDGFPIENNSTNSLQKVLTKSSSGSVLLRPKQADREASAHTKTPINKGFCTGEGGIRTRGTVINRTPV